MMKGSKERQQTCPRCGSTEVSKSRFSGKAFAISILLLGFPIPFIKKEAHCFDCGLDFKT
jgi:transcription elongation factor Elf1